MKTTLKAGLLASVAEAAFATASPNQANAEAYGLSNVEVQNLLLSGAPQFGSVFTFSSLTFANLINAGLTDAHFDSQNFPGGAPDPGHSFVASGPNNVANPGENSFSGIGPGNANFARADTNVTDSVINTVGSPVLSGGGDWQGIAEADVVGQETGIGNTGNIDLKWDFGAPGFSSGDVATITFDLDVSLAAAVSGSDDGTATSSFSIVVKFQDDDLTNGDESQTFTVASQLNADGGQSFTFDESGLVGGGGVSFGAVGANVAGFVPVTITTNPFGSETNFRLTIAAVQGVTVTAAPEPGTLALFGSGLLGLGFLGRRRRQKTA